MSPKVSCLEWLRILISKGHTAVFSGFTQMHCVDAPTIHPHIRFIPRSLGVFSDCPTDTEYHSPAATRGSAPSVLTCFYLLGCGLHCCWHQKWPLEASPPCRCHHCSCQSWVCAGSRTLTSAWLQAASAAAFCNPGTFEWRAVLVFTGPFIPTPSP